MDRKIIRGRNGTHTQERPPSPKDIYKDVVQAKVREGSNGSVHEYAAHIASLYADALMDELDGNGPPYKGTYKTGSRKKLDEYC